MRVRSEFKFIYFSNPKTLSIFGFYQVKTCPKHPQKSHFDAESGLKIDKFFLFPAAAPPSRLIGNSIAFGGANAGKRGNKNFISNQSETIPRCPLWFGG